MKKRLMSAVKHAALTRWMVPHSPVDGLSPSVYAHFRDRRDVVLIDVGAHQGKFVRGLRQVCSVEDCLMIEPIPRLAAELRANPEFSTYKVFEGVASNQAGEVELHVFTEAPDMSSVYAINSRNDDAMRLVGNGKAVSKWSPSCRLDDLAAEHFSDRIDLIKIDVQGAELDVLAGSIECLGRTAAIFVEVSFAPVYERAARFDPLCDMLRDAGFKMVALEPCSRFDASEILQADVLFINPNVWNKPALRSKS